MTHRVKKQLRLSVAPDADAAMRLLFDYGQSGPLGFLRIAPEDFAEFVEGIRAGFPDARISMKREEGNSDESD